MRITCAATMMTKRVKPITQCVIRSLSSSSSSGVKKRAPSAAVSSIPQFDPPANSPSAFLAELKAFAAQARKGRGGADVNLTSLLPLSFSGDADKILRGERRVVDRNSEFNFQCSACGSCCKSFPNDVMLDPHDVFLISRAKGAFQQQPGDTQSVVESRLNTRELFRVNSKAFQMQLGLFESSSAAVTSSVARDAARPNSALHSAASAQHKLAPVLFLRTKKVRQVSKENKAQSVIVERCWFSSPIDKIPIEKEDVVEDDPQHSKNSPTLIRPPASTPTSAATPAKGLTCRLGPAHQPTSCALYPLGELYNVTSANPSTPPVTYYTLDTFNCEGTHVRPSPTTKMTVASYAKRNALDERRKEWEWFEKDIAQPFAHRGWLRLNEGSTSLQSQLPFDFREELQAIVTNVWYNFDSMGCAPKSQQAKASQFPDWSSARMAITKANNTLIDATTTYVRQAKDDEKAARKAWRAALAEAGVLASH